jgi:DNA-binding PadR family transcriptional regulator
MPRKKRYADIEHFAKIPVSVLESEAGRTLPHAAFKVLVILASQWRGGNNGTLALTERYGRRFGLSGRDTLYRSLRELERRGLIVCTRRGFKSKKMFSLFALGWESITHRDGVPLDTPEPKDNTRWLKWTAGASAPIVGTKIGCRRKISAVETTPGGAEIHTDGRERLGPMVGTDDRISVPKRTDRSPVSIPVIGNTSKFCPERATVADARNVDPMPSASGETGEFGISETSVDA